MFQLSKWLVGLSLILGVTSVHAFSLLGPYDSWQTPEIGYNRRGDIGGPMNLGEEYRWNVPTITYAFDATFVEYFGTNGIAAVDQAMKILNDLPPASRLDPNDFLLNTVSSNPQAAGLGLFDLKSTALTFLVEELGLAEPERWTYALRRRDVIGTPPFTNYLVIQRNFDPITYKPTNVVNGVSFNYIVVDPRYANPDGADAVEIPDTTSSVAGGFVSVGDFYFGLTRDDVGGLKYLYKPTTLNVETLPNNTFLSTRLGQSSGGSPWTPVFFGTNLFGTNVFGTNQTGNVLVNAGLRGGVNKLTFRKVNFDSILGGFFNPVTNRYRDRVIVNGKRVTQSLERTVFQPDILFAAADFAQVATGILRTDTSGWINLDALNSNSGFPAGGPGVIPGGIGITFSKLGPYFINQSPGFEQGPGFQGIVWGSFDATQIYQIYPETLNFTVTDLEALLLQGRNP